jgi:hypothetical protein
MSVKIDYGHSECLGGGFAFIMIIFLFILFSYSVNTSKTVDKLVAVCAAKGIVIKP